MHNFDLTPVRFASWAAVSSQEQAEKESIDDQIRLNREWVDNLGRLYHGHSGQIVAELRVVGSRSIVQLHEAAAIHEEYGRLSDMIRDRQIDAVICRSRDRLGRVDALVMTIEQLCLKNNVAVVARQSPPITLDARELARVEHGGLAPAIEGFLAQSAVRRLVNENERGMLARVRVDRKFPSNLPWGYLYRYLPDGAPAVEVDQSVAETIRTIFRLYLGEHLGHREIADRMNALGHQPARGALWTDNMVKNVLKNADAYAGYVTINRRSRAGRPLARALGNHEPIISEETHANLAAARSKRSQVRAGRGRPFSGIVVCAVCGYTMASQVQYYEAGGERVPYHRLRCTHCRPRHSITESVIEDALIQAIDRLAQYGDLSAFYGNARRALIGGDGEERRKHYDARLVEVDAKRQRLLELYVSRGDINPVFFGAEMDRLGREEVSLHASIARLDSAQAADRDVDAAIERLRAVRDLGRAIIENRDADPRGARLWLQSCVRVYVRPEDGSTEVDHIAFI